MININQTWRSNIFSYKHLVVGKNHWTKIYHLEFDRMASSPRHSHYVFGFINGPENYTPGKLTYPTLVKGKSYSKVPWDGTYPTLVKGTSYSKVPNWMGYVSSQKGNPPIWWVEPSTWRPEVCTSTSLHKHGWPGRRLLGDDILSMLNGDL